MQQQVRRSLATVVGALVVGALGGYLAGLVRPRPALAYASDYAAPHPDLVPLLLESGDEPAVDRAPVLDVRSSAVLDATADEREGTP